MTGRDRHVRRDGEDYAEAFASLLPTGPAWPRDPDSALMRYVQAQAEIWGAKVDPRAADLLETESDPRSTLELLPEWERAFGLPDPCVTEPLTIEARRTALVNRIIAQGGQSRAFFIGVAERLGYTITIREFSPFMAGVSQAGDTRALDDGTHYRWECGPPEIRFYWVVKVDATRLSWFRAGSGQAGLDPHCRIGRATDLECLFRRWAPGHTQVVFDYSSLAIGQPPYFLLA